jgi:hypothetical protein
MPTTPLPLHISPETTIGESPIFGAFSPVFRSFCLQKSTVIDNGRCFGFHAWSLSSFGASLEKNRA